MEYNKSVIRPPNNPETLELKKSKNLRDFSKIESEISRRSSNLTKINLQLANRSTEIKKTYDDDVIQTINDLFYDRVTVFPFIGDIMRATKVLLRFIRYPKPVPSSTFIEQTIRKITLSKRITRFDISQMTKVSTVNYNNVKEFMNGGPLGENWNRAPNGFYDWIDNKSKESILSIELGFKADNYGMEVCKKLIEKKRSNPSMHISLLIDGLVSVLMQKPPTSLKDFEVNTLKMIDDMRKAGISVYVNDSWNPLSSDFLAANHIKLWIFDGSVAFFGGIGIESQFRDILFDEMDLVQGPFVRVLTMMTLLIMSNQKSRSNEFDNIKQFHEMEKKEIKKLFIKQLPKEGNITIRLSMNVPGYVQDAQSDYVDLLLRKDMDEIFIMAPYFSDDKIARALVRSATFLYSRRYKEKKIEFKKDMDKYSKKEFKELIDKEIAKEKKIHIIFPKKQENRIIEEVSKYYAYYLRNNPLVETLQFYAESGGKIHEMLHAKQLLIVLKNRKKNWTKYVKFGGSYNPAGRAHNMWELNAVMYKGPWKDSDDLDALEDNDIKNYLEKVMKVVVSDYSQPFPWGSSKIYISPLQRASMKLAQLSWV
ncbi:hypothetical protein NMY3_03171 [Candidatus Nitrosocosmicus oleophilus]|uniref:PLD phosphodiesterase domain-containing protein n=1 Tax=Candidatus Nitrosocosmicus oleophilus TaxID=1353260 RepID=A0A654M3Y2_9ARCH|nr:hypothetical protein [Candidatus Nitrosocosmicus oleophilus]ALI37356.1 hypothetical protein NMY3_03171 [Candidatus Nitrosocosmicus oleophilus]